MLIIYKGNASQENDKYNKSKKKNIELVPTLDKNKYH